MTARTWPNDQRFFGHEKALKMHVTGINFISFTGQIYNYNAPNCQGKAKGDLTLRPYCLHCMQVNFYGNPCIPAVFFIITGYREKQNLAPKSYKNTPFQH